MRNRFCWLFVAACLLRPSIHSVVQGADRPASSPSTNKTNVATENVEIREFDVRVDNRVAGTHRLTIKSDGASHQVGFQTDVKFNFIVYAYVFKFRGTEVWRDGRLEQADIHCEDGGKKRSFLLKTDDNAIQQVSFNGQSVDGATTPAMTTAYWQLPMAELRAKSFPIVDVDTGILHDAKIAVIGPATVSASGRTLKCQHVKIDGPSPSELWFDENDLLVGQKSVERGHLTELRLTQIRMAKEER